MSGNVTAANLRAVQAAASGMDVAHHLRRVPAASASLLGKRRKRQNQKNCKQTR